MGSNTYVMNIQTKTSQDEDKGLVYNHDKARVVKEHGQQDVVTYSLKAGNNKFSNQAKASAHKEMKQLHDRSCFRPVHKCLLVEKPLLTIGLTSSCLRSVCSCALL